VRFGVPRRPPDSAAHKRAAPRGRQWVQPERCHTTGRSGIGRKAHKDAIQACRAARQSRLVSAAPATAGLGVGEQHALLALVRKLPPDISEQSAEAWNGDRGHMSRSRDRHRHRVGGSGRDRTCEGTSWGGCPSRPSWPPRSRSRRCQSALFEEGQRAGNIAGHERAEATSHRFSVFAALAVSFRLTTHELTDWPSCRLAVLPSPTASYRPSR
jgi:hypothetical protein